MWWMALWLTRLKLKNSLSFVVHALSMLIAPPPPQIHFSPFDSV